ncbi:MAG: hypothetical protein AAF850_08890 [Pseudomonadota bacterium]
MAIIKGFSVLRGEAPWRSGAPEPMGLRLWGRADLSRDVRSKARATASAFALLALAACSAETDVAQTSGAEPMADAQEASPTPVVDEAIEPFQDADAPGYVGVWASAGVDCEKSPGADETSPIAFTPEEFISADGLCRVGHAEPTDADAWRIEMICDADGVEFTDLMDVRVVDAELTTVRGEVEARYRRCVNT